MTLLPANRPFWSPSQLGAFQEVWYLKLNQPQENRSLWLRFTLLNSANGFRRLAETWAIAAERVNGKDTTHLAVKQSFPIQEFRADDQGFRIRDCEFTENRTRGMIQSKGNQIKWDLEITPARELSFNLVPETLTKMGVVKNTAFSTYEDLRFTGTSEVNGQVRQWNLAPGMQAHLSGPKNGHSWAWGQCNAFVGEQGQPVDFIFEGLSARARLGGGLKTPQLSTFLFVYQGKEYRFNSFWDAVRSRSKYNLGLWEFQCDQGDLSFRGQLRAELKDFAGVTYEDTDGSFLYCANSKLSRLTILVYRSGKLEATVNAPGTAAFEVVTRQKNPYIPLLI